MNEWMNARVWVVPLLRIELLFVVRFYFYWETISLPSQPSLVSLVKKEKIKKSWKKNETYFVFLIVV